MGNAESSFKFTQCQDKFLALMNGTIDNINGVTNANLNDSGWIWTGPLARLGDFPREQILAITYQGCLDVCGNKTQYNTANTALNIAATWLFPLAILFNLPYESLHRKKLQKSVEAACHWLGSPQTAMTSTIFNFDQIRTCAKLAIERPHGAGQEWNDAYYVLSCMNQFSLPMQVVNGSRRVDDRFMLALVYGLFRPLRAGPNNHLDDNRDIEMTRRLLSQMATKLRDHRRRGVLPTIFSLGTFLVAFIFSVVLAFGEVGDDISVTPLTIGLLYGWLPLLVITTIVDRNPTSSDRTAEFMSRWLHNVDAVRTWKVNGANQNPADIDWWTGYQKVAGHFQLGNFIGQGRTMEYCGLAYTVARTVTKPYDISDDGNLYWYNSYASDVIARLEHRPWLWWSAALRAFFLTWVQIMMAFIVAITSPTASIGCWSGSFLVFGGLTSFSWSVSLFKKSCGPKLRLACTVVNVASLAWLIFVTGLILTGALYNCYCHTTWMSYPHSGGYMVFVNDKFIRDHFDVVVPWAASCSISFFVALVVLFTSLFGWMSCDHLWTTYERGRPALPLRPGVYVSRNWLE